MTWFYLTILAVLFQTKRNALQKSLRTSLDTITVSWSRLFYSLPILIGGIIYLYTVHPDIIVSAPSSFFIHCFFAALTQLLGTLCLVELFSCRNFLVGISFMKTDTIQAAVLAALFLSESMDTRGIIATLLSVIGILCLSPPHASKPTPFSLFNKSMFLGLGTGLCLSSTSIFMKKAMTVAPTHSKLLAIVSVFIIYTLMQYALYVLYQTYRKSLMSSISSLLLEWKTCSLIGLFSLGGTLCWLGAFLLHHIAYVKIVGQLEIVLSFLVTHHFFKEKCTPLEYAGILLVTISTIAILR